MGICRICEATVDGRGRICPECKVKENERLAEERAAKATLKAEVEKKIMNECVNQCSFVTTKNGMLVNELDREDLLSLYLSTIHLTITDARLRAHATKIFGSRSVVHNQ